MTHSPIRAPEEELILNCARTSIEPPAAERIRHLAGQGLDWAYVLEVCRRHGVSPLLYKSLKILDQRVAPQSVMKRLQEQFYRNLAHNLRLDTELTALLDKFEKHGIRAIPYKGVALAISVYGDLTLRVFGDLDILIQKRSMQTAVELMISLGYQPEFQFDQKRMAAYMRSFYELPFAGSGKAPVELQWEICADHFAFPLAPLSIWHDQRPRDACESGYRSFPAEKLLLMLCIHGAKDSWERLAWICDVAELIRRSNRLDWDGLVNLAAQTGGLRMLYLGLHLAHELLEAPIPEEILLSIRKDRIVAKTGQMIRERLFRSIDGTNGVLQTCLFYIMMRERLRDKARFIFRTFSRPIPGQWDQLDFDDFWARLSSVIRHVSMGFSHGLGLAKQRWKGQVRTITS